MECFTSKEWLNYLVFTGIHYMNLNYKQDLIEKKFSQEELY